MLRNSRLSHPHLDIVDNEPLRRRAAGKWRDKHARRAELCSNMKRLYLWFEFARPADVCAAKRLYISAVPQLSKTAEATQSSGVEPSRSTSNSVRSTGRKTASNCRLMLGVRCLLFSIAKQIRA
jgi:hypothetical protein